MFIYLIIISENLIKKNKSNKGKKIPLLVKENLTVSTLNNIQIYNYKYIFQFYKLRQFGLSDLFI